MVREVTGSPGHRAFQVAWTVFALVALYAFLQDFMSPDWRAGIVAPVLLIAFRGAISALPEEGLTRALLWQGALILIPFMGLYGLLDLFFASDIPVWIISPIIILGLWALFFQLVSAEVD